MQLDLAGKVALVTGSTRGIGRTIAQTLHAEGCRVVVNGRDAAEVAVVAASLPGAVAAAGDVTSPADAERIVAAALAAFARLDVLVCNVGSGRSVPPGAETPGEWQRVMAINLFSTTNMVQAARLPLRAAKGAIVCISSICGLEVIAGAPVTYSAAKAALHAYVRGIARPLGAEGIRINAVAPGNILFDGSVWDRKLREDRAGVERMLERDVALRKLGTPAEVAGLVAYLASSRCGFVTGAVWTVDGGQISA